MSDFDSPTTPVVLSSTLASPMSFPTPRSAPLPPIRGSSYFDGITSDVSQNATFSHHTPVEPSYSPSPPNDVGIRTTGPTPADGACGPPCVTAVEGANIQDASVGTDDENSRRETRAAEGTQQLLPLRSSSVPVRPLQQPYRHRRHRDEHGGANRSTAPLVAFPKDPERGVKKAAAIEIAKSAFFHGSFTSSHGAMVTRQTPLLKPATSPHFSVDVASRTRQRALLLMPPAMRAKYLQFQQHPGLDAKLADHRPPANRDDSRGRQQHQHMGKQPSPERNVHVARASSASSNRRPTFVGLRPSTPLVPTLGKLSENDEMLQSESPRGDEEEQCELDEEIVSWTDAILELLPLAVPSIFSMAMTYGIDAIPLAFVGSHYGRTALAGASVASFLMSIVAQYPLSGLSFALDALVSHEFGSDSSSDVMGLLLQRAIIVNLLFCVPLCFVLLQAHIAFDYFYSEGVASVAGEFLEFSPLFVVACALNNCFTKFCSNQMLPQIPTIALGVGVACAPALQAWLIGYGARGAMLGIALCAWVQFVVVFVLSLLKKELRTSLGALRLREAVDIDDMKVYLQLALPSAIFVAAEASAFDVTVLMAAAIGDAECAAWSAILNCCLPFVSIAGGLSTAACAKVGASLGAGYPFDARRYAFAAIATAAVCACFNATIIVTFFDQLLSLFGCQARELAIGKALLDIIPFMHVADSIQFSFQGVFSGAGQNHKGAMILLSSLWAIGFPLSCFLAFFMNMGVRGVVLGLTIGLLIECPSMIYTVNKLDWPALSEEAQSDMDEEDEEDEEDDDETDDGEELKEICDRGRSTTPRV